MGNLKSSLIASSNGFWTSDKDAIAMVYFLGGIFPLKFILHRRLLSILYKDILDLHIEGYSAMPFQFLKDLRHVHLAVLPARILDIPRPSESSQVRFRRCGYLFVEAIFVDNCLLRRSGYLFAEAIFVENCLLHRSEHVTAEAASQMRTSIAEANSWSQIQIFSDMVGVDYLSSSTISEISSLIQRISKFYRLSFEALLRRYIRVL
nr:uncharacterized protein LOC104087932 isoform X2 [Nicotiana tomentosiformis]